jgi:hypothetical protein
MIKLMYLLLIASSVAVLSSPALAADISLVTGDSVILQPNTTTRVTCNIAANQVTCDESIAYLEKLLQACKADYDPANCIDKYWPDFRQENPRCAREHIDLCIHECSTSHSASSCADKCK